jgi:LPXTG-motif cell wall-anchored protein
MRRWTIALAALLLLALPAAAQAQNYTTRTGNLGVSDPTVTPGQTITVTGSGYASNASVTITMESQPVTLKTTTANASGQLNTQVTIPTNATPGNHTLRATGRSSDGGTLVLSASLVVSSGGQTGALPRTGPTSAAGLTAIGFLLAAVGGCAAAVKTRRKTATEGLFGGNLFRW